MVNKRQFFFCVQSRPAARGAAESRLLNFKCARPDAQTSRMAAAFACLYHIYHTVFIYDAHSPCGTVEKNISEAKRLSPLPLTGSVAPNTGGRDQRSNMTAGPQPDAVASWLNELSLAGQPIR